jgi:hypothetical protein
MKDEGCVRGNGAGTIFSARLGQPGAPYAHALVEPRLLNNAPPGLSERIGKFIFFCRANKTQSKLSVFNSKCYPIFATLSPGGALLSSRGSMLAKSQTERASPRRSWRERASLEIGARLMFLGDGSPAKEAPLSWTNPESPTSGRLFSNSKPARNTGGAPAGSRRSSPSATAPTRARSSRRFRSSPPKLAAPLFATVSRPPRRSSATEPTRSFRLFRFASVLEPFPACASRRPG